MSIVTSEIRVGPMAFKTDIAGPDGGAPVLMLHGFPQSRRAWLQQLEVLGAVGYRAIAPDQRGYSPGARPLAPEAYGAQNMVADGFGLMDALGHDRFHLVGHDWGGQIAWMMATGTPARVLSLAVLSRPHPAAFARALKTDPGQSQRSGHHRSFLEEGAAERLRAGDLTGFRQMFAASGVPAETAEAYIATLRPPGALKAAIAWYRAGGAALRAADVPPATQRTLYVWGDADATVGRAAAEGTAAFVSGPYRFEPIPGAGHFLTDEVPKAVNRLLLEHLFAAS